MALVWFLMVELWRGVGFGQAGERAVRLGIASSE
jgi:hypothetical protein